MIQLVTSQLRNANASYDSTRLIKLFDDSRRRYSFYYQLSLIVVALAMQIIAIVVVERKYSHYCYNWTCSYSHYSCAIKRVLILVTASSAISIATMTNATPVRTRTNRLSPILSSVKFDSIDSLAN